MKLDKTHQKETTYGWLIIALGGLTNIFAVGVPLMCMPVLFNEISKDLNLSLVQIGAAWGMGGLASMIMSPFGGLIGDRFGTKRTILISCILIGIAGAGRGLSDAFFGLALSMFFYSVFQNTIVLNIHKTCGVWFSGKKTVIANGIVSAGIAMGMLLGALISDTIMSPLLGGWRNVLYLYGAISVFMSLLWYVTRNEPAQYENNKPTNSPIFREALTRVIRQKNVWLFGLTHFCYVGAIMGTVGYLPLYLRGIGWSPAGADGALAALNGAGMIGAVPASIVSARLGLRKGYIMWVFIVTLISLALLPMFHGFVIWPLAILVGVMRDGYFAVLMTMVIESRRVGPVYAGTAMGIIFSFGNLGTFISAPMGNWLAVIRTDFAFFFWAALILIALVIFSVVGEKGEAEESNNRQ